MISGRERREFVVNLSISREQFLKVYRGTASKILAAAENGQRVQFPASALQPYVRHSGVNGVFKLLVDSKNKLIRIEKNAA